MGWGNAVKRKTAIIVAVITGLVVAVVASLFLVRVAEDRVTQDLVSRVDHFSIPADWVQESEIVRPERFLCMSTNPCPSIYRRWNAGTELTPDELQGVVTGVGFEMKTEGTCQRRPNDIGPTSVCTSSGTDGEYDYIMNVTDRDGAEPRLVVLDVRPHQ
jgi:hypothetical protein